MADSIEKIVNTTLNVNTGGGVNSVNALLGAFNSLGGGVTGVISHLIKFAPAIAAIGGVVAVIGGIAVALNQAKNAAADFQKDMANVNTLLAGSVVGIKQLSDEVLVMSGRIPLVTKDLANGLYQVVSAGIPAAEAMDVLATGARAAVGGVTDSATSLKVLIGVINAYGYATSDAGMVSDKLFEAVKLGIFNYQELATTLGTVIPQAVSLKVPLDTLLAGMVGLTRGGYDAAQASTALRGILNQLLSPSDALAATVKKLGYENAESMVKTLGLKGTLDKLAAATGGSASEMAKLFPEVRGMGAVMSLTGNQADSFAEAIDGVGNSAGAADEAFQAQMSTLRENEQLMKNNFQKVLIELGEKTVPFATRAVMGLTAALGDLALAWMKPGQGTPLGDAHEKLAAIEADILKTKTAASSAGWDWAANKPVDVTAAKQHLIELLYQQKLYQDYLKGNITSQELALAVKPVDMSGNGVDILNRIIDSGKADRQAAADAAALKKKNDAIAAANKQLAADMGNIAADGLKLSTTATDQQIAEIKKQAAAMLANLNKTNETAAQKAKDRVAIAQWETASIAAIEAARPKVAQIDAENTAAADAKAVASLKLSAEKDLQGSLIDLRTQTYKATHTLVEGEMYDVNLQAKAYLAAGIKKSEVDQWVAENKVEIDRQAATSKVEIDRQAAEDAAAVAKEEAVKEGQAQADAMQDKLEKTKEAMSELSQVISDGYQLERDAAVDAQNEASKGRQKAISNAMVAERQKTSDLIDEIDKRLKRELDAIDTAKDARLDALSTQTDAQTGSIDAQIADLEGVNQTQSRADTMAGLQTTLSNAKTPQTIADAERAILKEKNKEEYTDKLASLQAQRTAIIEAAAKEHERIQKDAVDKKKVLQEDAVAEKEQLQKDLVAFTKEKQDELDVEVETNNEKLKELDRLYALKMAKRNTDAAAEIMVAQHTWDTIRTMIQTTQVAWSTNPFVTDSMFSNISALTSTAIPEATDMSPTWNMGAGQAGYGNYAVPHYATGGTAWYPQLAMVGENGPEDITPRGQKSQDSASSAISSQLSTMVRLLYKVAEGIPNVSASIQQLGRGLGAHI